MTDEGYDAMVDRLMACEGYDREEAEIVAVATLAGVPVKTVARALSCECGDTADCCEGETA